MKMTNKTSRFKPRNLTQASIRINNNNNKTEVQELPESSNEDIQRGSKILLRAA